MAELGGEIEKGPLPDQRAEADVDAGQDSIRVGHDQVARVRIHEIAQIHAGRHRGGGADREGSAQSRADHVRRVDHRHGNHSGQRGVIREAHEYHERVQSLGRRDSRLKARHVGDRRERVAEPGGRSPAHRADEIGYSVALLHSSFETRKPTSPNPEEVPIVPSLTTRCPKAQSRRFVDAHGNGPVDMNWVCFAKT